MMSPPRLLSFFSPGGGPERVEISSTAPYPDPDASPNLNGEIVGDGGGESIAISHMINPPSPCPCFPSTLDKLAAYPGDNAVERMTSSNASVEVDKRCNNAKSNVKSGHVGNSNEWLDEAEHTPSPKVNAENDIVAADDQCFVVF